MPGPIIDPQPPDLQLGGRPSTQVHLEVLQVGVLEVLEVEEVGEVGVQEVLEAG